MLTVTVDMAPSTNDDDVMVLTRKPGSTTDPTTEHGMQHLLET